MTIKIDQETILDLMDAANIVGFCIHKLTDLIRAGKTEGECYSELNNNYKATFQDFPTIDDYDYEN
tara:strand:- start:590 stop:787 length:198 start_codon:yes stop_codon:yes gene_type:complete